MSDFSGLYDIRYKMPSDDNFILSTFLKGVYYGNSWYNLIPKVIFMSEYKPFAEMLLTSKCLIKVACLKDDPETIIGYIILSPDEHAVVWTYVKEKWRNRKVGRSLLSDSVIFATHITDNTKPLLKKFNITFNPFAIK